MKNWARGLVLINYPDFHALQTVGADFCSLAQRPTAAATSRKENFCFQFTKAKCAAGQLTSESTDTLRLYPLERGINKLSHFGGGASSRSMEPKKSMKSHSSVK